MSGLSETIFFSGLVTSLDLSYNSFSGEIPLSLANCSHLNVLKLDHNQLAGPVPVFTSTSVATAESYANNLGLCGGPLRACQGAPKKSHVGVVIAAAAVGGIAFSAIIVGIVLYYFSRGVASREV
ncbi:hypothetical protein FH972_006229 [Carpinus fangiana]|uniref:Leucine-rich repeat-containing N-terminal plant-type domain-containing protein n=1 Tax=Carpinus fangiana TaxID=176857 RepID=A0A5N6QRM8_9ROSI|nr:hypothetical protein FH972_006229 [Carpinus fangiana]